MTFNDIKKLVNLGIKNIVNLRSCKEKLLEPIMIIENTNYHEMPIPADCNIRDELKQIINGTLERFKIFH